jgi:probable HAF family extracellular repeat protein
MKLQMRVLQFVFVVATMLVDATSSDAGSYSFQGIGGFPGATAIETSADAVSADGSVVVGSGSLTNGGVEEAFRWTETTGVVPLGFAPNSSVSVASAVSADGSVITGWNNNGEAYRWTAMTGMVGIGNIGGSTFAYGISADGNVIVGVDENSLRYEPFRWTTDGGMIGLGSLGGLQPNYSRAQAVSPDGSIVVGWDRAPSGDEAFRWTAATGMVPLGWLSSTSPFTSEAGGVSADGSIVVGDSVVSYSPSLGITREAFRWTAATGMVGLGNLPSETDSFAGAITPDGSIIVGASGLSTFIWTSSTGMLNLTDILASHGVTGFEGWQLRGATGISADGRTIIGTGNDPAGNIEGWVVTIPEPSSGGMFVWVVVVVFCAYRRGIHRTS